MSAIVYKKDDNDSLSIHFNINEFRCPCTQCVSILVDSVLVERLEAMRATIGQPLRINSGYRCSNYQTELRLRGYETSAGPSTHEVGGAADIMSEPLTGPQLEKIARQCGFRAVGVGGTWIHVDIRDDKDRRWEYAR